MKLYIKKVSGLTQEGLPSQANVLDAGYDIIATSHPKIKAEKEDTIEAAPLIDDKPNQYRRVAYIEYETNLYWSPAKSTEQRVKTLETKRLEDNSGMIVTAYEIVADIIDWHIELFPRSSISKYNLVLANSVGTIDTGYLNQVLVRFKYLFAPQDLSPRRKDNGDFELVGVVNPKYLYQRGDKIVQLKPRQNVPVQFEFVDELPTLDSRGLGGFGSSDRK